jgi:energy-coupling factor transport system ATP-binding protein
LGWGQTPFTVQEAFLEIDVNHLSPQVLLNFQEGNAIIVGPHPSALGPVVEAEDVWFYYKDRPILRGVHLRLDHGECVALIGRNGAGKTTLVKHLNGLLKPDRGSLKVLGQDTRKTSVSKLARHVGFAWQNPNDQLFRTTVREEVLTGPRVLRAYDSVWCDRLFERLGLGPLLDRSPFSLSEGQKKRVSFAAALAPQPGLIIFDEPTAGQDDLFRRELAELIHELRREGRTVVLVTHDLEFAAQHAGRWLILAEGQIIADGSPDAVMANRAAMAKAGLRPTQRFQLIQALKKPSKEGEIDRVLT